MERQLSIAIGLQTAVVRAVREGYVHDHAAAWLHAEDIETLFAEPLDAAR